MSLDAIRAAWCRETSYWPDQWTPETPAYGQCAVTALAVQDQLGGAIWRGRVEFLSHYWNEVDGHWLDLTLEQFPPGGKRIPDVPVSREVLLRDPDTLQRYELLKSRMETPPPAAGQESPVGCAAEHRRSGHQCPNNQPREPK